MPKDQQERVWKTFDKNKIVKILRDKALMNDCILYSDFSQWQTSQPAPQKPTVAVHSVNPAFGKLAFE